MDRQPLASVLFDKQLNGHPSLGRNSSSRRGCQGSVSQAGRSDFWPATPLRPPRLGKSDGRVFLKSPRSLAPRSHGGASAFPPQAERMPVRPGLLLLLLAFSVPAPPGSAACARLAPCQCFGGATVFCSGRNVSGIPEELPPEASQLLFVGASLSVLPCGAFAPRSNGSSALRKLAFLGCPLRTLPGCAWAGLPRLRELDVALARLAGLPREALGGLGGLSKLAVRFSQLEALEEGLFDGTPALEALHLQGNRLAALSPRLFRPLPALESLSLAQNRLAQLPADTFRALVRLRELRLSDNLLERLPPRLFRPLQALRELFLDGNRLAELPRGLFAGLARLRRLHLQHNALARLEPPGLFAGLPGLAFLLLQGNRLAALPAGLFRGTPRLVELSLARNRLLELPEGLFGDLPELSVLSLAHNRLGRVTAGTFRGLAGLGRLQLRYNCLSALPGAAFANLSSLEALDLAHNRLQSLPEGFFDANEMLASLALEGNPWRCDCRLAPLADWLSTMEQPLGARVLCRTPAPLEGRTLLAAREEELLCPCQPGSARCRGEAPAPPEETGALGREAEGLPASFGTGLPAAPGRPWERKARRGTGWGMKPACWPFTGQPDTF
ncbi:carboxypeptidase N subunit 2 [Crotalus adamanteus]|uniref:Carboxypeptidase N subunit 2 n=1 Tax=Crotalus adamanteus TaxID=8729 RepID=A0AAW1BJ61_CROAD